MERRRGRGKREAREMLRHRSGHHRNSMKREGATEFQGKAEGEDGDGGATISIHPTNLRLSPSLSPCSLILGG